MANRDLYGADFQWVDESQIATREYPADVAVIERTEWGALIGTIKEVRRGDQVVASGSQAGWAEVEKRLPDASRVRAEIRGIEKGEIGRDQLRPGADSAEAPGPGAPRCHVRA